MSVSVGGESVGGEAESLALLEAEIRSRAAEVGFVRMGVARAEPLEPEGARLREWLSAGRHADMDWMERTADVRIDAAHSGMLPSARSVLVFATPYAREASAVGPHPGIVARYARGRDYHNVLHKRLRKLTGLLRQRGHEARAAVDSMPVFERAWAQRSGLGFIGKNCCVIVPGLGSHVLLSAIVTSAELPADDPIKERCGSCRRCLDTCPTDAFVGVRELDARRCISYLTIETRGAVPESLRPGLGDWIFGCDACQDVCPFNATAPPDEDQTQPFAPHERFERTTATDLLAMDDARFDAWAHGSPLKRPGRDGMARNAALVLGNVGGRRHLPVLEGVARQDRSPVVREAAAWAGDQIRQREKDE